MLHQLGGARGVRDSGAIESALARPYSGYHRSIERKAAALVHSLVLNHGFVDGNKRTAIHMLGILLQNSGYGLRFANTDEANDQVERLMLEIAEHKISFEGIISWLKERLTKVDQKSWIVTPRKPGLRAGD